jgi:hypothetical protein
MYAEGHHYVNDLSEAFGNACKMKNFVCSNIWAAMRKLRVQNGQKTRVQDGLQARVQNGLNTEFNIYQICKKVNLHVVWSTNV